MMEQTTELRNLLARSNERLRMREKNYVEIEQFLFHAQAAGDRVRKAAQEIVAQSALAHPDDPHAELLFQLSQYACAVDELVCCALSNGYKQPDPEDLDLTELRVFGEKLKMHVMSC